MQSLRVPDNDLFASRLYHKVPKYASWKLDPLASFVELLLLGRVRLEYSVITIYSGIVKFFVSQTNDFS